MSRLEDIKLLKRALKELDAESDDKRVVTAIEAFTDMLAQLRGAKGGGNRQLTKKQRAWVLRILDEPEPYENLVSEGKVPRGREVPTPPVLTHRPLKPPGRK